MRRDSEREIDDKAGLLFLLIQSETSNTTGPSVGLNGDSGVSGTRRMAVGESRRILVVLSSVEYDAMAGDLGRSGGEDGRRCWTRRDDGGKTMRGQAIVVVGVVGKMTGKTTRGQAIVVVGLVVVADADLGPTYHRSSLSCVMPMVGRQTFPLSSGFLAPPVGGGLTTACGGAVAFPGTRGGGSDRHQLREVRGRYATCRTAGWRPSLLP